MLFVEQALSTNVGNLFKLFLQILQGERDRLKKSVKSKIKKMVRIVSFIACRGSREEED